MKKLPIYFLWISLLVISCRPEPIVPEDKDTREKLGTISFSFIYQVPGLPVERIKRVFLGLAYTQDSLNLGLFLTSTNVSDVISTYQIFVPEGSYYFQATIMCLCAGDSCKYSGFTGQYGTKAAGHKIDVFKDQITKVTTQFQ